jgi:hypothetical protein
MRYGGGDRAEADPLGHAEADAELEDVVAQLFPAEVGLGAVQDEEVASIGLAMVQLQRRPDESRERAVDDVERRTAGSVVEQDVAVEGRDRLAAAREHVGRIAGRARRVDPSVERGDDDRTGERPGNVSEAIERHSASIVPALRDPVGRAATLAPR